MTDRDLKSEAAETAARTRTGDPPRKRCRLHEDRPSLSLKRAQPDPESESGAEEKENKTKIESVGVNLATVARVWFLKTENEERTKKEMGIKIKKWISICEGAKTQKKKQKKN